MVPDKERTLFVHIGLPKTGTSALQVFFARNAQSFYRKGLRYPGVSERVGVEEVISSGNGAKIAKSAFLHEELDEQASGLSLLTRVLQASDRNVLLSSEYFSLWEGERHLALRRYAAAYGYSVRILVYLRDQADIVVTHYFQNLKRRPGYVDIAGDNFLSFAHEYLDTQPYLDFSGLLGMLSGVYGADKVRVKGSKRSGLVGGNLLLDALDAVGIAADESIDLNISKVNPTPTQHEMYIRAVMGMFLPSLSTSDSFLRVISKIHAENPVFAQSDKNFFIDPAVVADIRSRFLESNTRVCEEWFGGRLYSELFDQKHYGEKVVFDNASVDINSLISVFGGLLVEVLGRLEKLEGKRA